MVKWTDIENSPSSNIKWSDIEGDQSTFGSGLAQRMSQYEGLSPEAASAQYISGQKQTFHDIADTLTDPAKLKAAASTVLSSVYGAARHPAQTVENLAKHYYENPDALATDVALAAVPVEGVAALGTRRALESYDAAKTASLPERIANLPERPAAPVIPEAQRTAEIKAQSGAGIQASKDAGVTVPASEAKGLLDEIKASTASEYNPETHDAARGFFKKFESKLPKEDEAKAALSAQMARMAPVPRASLEARLAALGPKEEASITVKDLHNLRQELNDVHKHAYRSGYDQEGMVASKAKDAIDEFIVNKMGQGEWPTDMRNYALASTAEEIRNLVDRSLYRTSQLSAGQRAARLNTELRNWARPTYKGPNARMKMLRKLSPEAADKMEALATARDPTNTLLKMMGTAAPTSIAPVVLDEFAGHLFTSLLGVHVNPMLLMAGGAVAKHMGGARIERGIEGIIKTLNDAAESGPRVEGLQKVVSPGVFQQLMQRPRTAQAIRNWANAKGGRKTAATVALTSAIAKEVNRPDLQQRIKNEIDNIDPERQTIVPKTQTAEMQ